MSARLNRRNCLRIGSLFSGYGGLDLAVESVTGARTVWTSDVDKGACKILAHRFPDAPNLGDLTAIDWTTVEPVEIVTAGFPCTDLSKVGGRAGMHAGTRSGLWSYVTRAVDVLRPRLVVAENVRGILSGEATSNVEPCPWCMGDNRRCAMRALGVVLADLADLGYDARWTCLRASDAGAPHERERVFIVAAPTHPDGIPAGLRPLEMGGDEGGERQSRAPDNGHARRGAPVPPRRGPDPVLDPWREYAGVMGEWAAIVGRPVPALSDDLTVISEFLMGLPAGWITNVPGITRNEALKACGNGVVPQQAAAALRHMLEAAA